MDWHFEHHSHMKLFLAFIPNKAHKLREEGDRQMQILTDSLNQTLGYDRELRRRATVDVTTLP